MMGNEKSQPVGLLIDEIPIEVTKSWTLHSATYSSGNVPKVSVFTTTQSSEVSRLERFTKNILVYRHPSIIKYVASWKKGQKLYLATEPVLPLSQVLPYQTSLQICIGLQNILKALLFLHETGCVSHNNVCQAAVYVTQGGLWKLGGFEYLSKFNDISSSYLNEIRSCRYDLAISPEEEAQLLPQPLSSIDGYAFGVLVQESLANKFNDDIPGMVDFLDLCKKRLQNAKPELRPSLSDILTHSYFNHNFISIHNFLRELPIKEDNEKEEFFRNLSAELDLFPQEIVASHLGSLLLSRIVLLDSTAQRFLLPHVFNPKRENIFEGGMFCESTFKTYMIPHLLHLFCVRDIQIRMILLSHFHSYCSLFSQVQLQSEILPELLVGIKDTNDSLVSATLKALADLVLILGGATVVGGKRSKLFADGKPKASSSSVNTVYEEKNLPTDLPLFTGLDKNEDLVLAERPSPDGGESEAALGSGKHEEAWPGWDIQPVSLIPDIKLLEIGNATVGSQQSSTEMSLSRERLHTIFSSEEKSQVSKGIAHKLSVDECDNLFREMEPIISKPHVVQVNENQTTVFNKFALANEISEAVDGWGESLDEWLVSQEDN